MALQARFRQFDEVIKLKRFDENAELREKRERVLARLREGMAKQFPPTQARPTFEWFNQGSYEMGTGVKPVDGDYDIDVGVVFNIDVARYPDPLAVKQWVFAAVREHTTDVRWRRPCVTVNYVEARESKYHVDLAVYGKDGWGNLHLAVGRQNATQAERGWLRSDPKKLTEIVGAKFQGEDADQFRRVIRLLKRWKDVRFRGQAAGAPTGIALTACALQWFAPRRSPSRSAFAWPAAGEYDDLVALSALVGQMRGAFRTVYDRARPIAALDVNLPVPPGNDLFAKLNAEQMQQLKGSIDALSGTLELAQRQDEWTASTSLRQVFGADFPA